MTRRLIASALIAAALAAVPAPVLAASAAPEAAARADAAFYDDLRAAQVELARVEVHYADARARHLDAPLRRADDYLGLAKSAFSTAKMFRLVNHRPAEAERWLTKGRAFLKTARMSLVPARGAETRGMFLDAGSLPKTEAGMTALVEKLHQANFNVLLPEVFRRGYTLYDSRFTDRDPEFKGAPDVLRVLVREAHRRGMEVHPWIWTFRVKSPGFGNPVLDKLPALAARKDGKESRFLSPASPQAREFIYGLVGEMVERYEVDGLMLDYIRYDEEIPEDDLSRTQFALEHQARTGKLPPYPIPPNSQLMVEWQLWREQQVNITVQELSRQLKGRTGRFPIGVAVFRGEGYSRLAKMQHWRHWSNNRWVDFAAPMLYTAKNEDLGRWLDWETDKHTRENLIYPILGVHRFDSPDNLIDEIAFLREQGVPGLMIFALAHFDMKLLDELKAGPFREPATLPHRNLVRATRKTLAQVNTYLEEVFRGGDFETAATARMLHAEVSSVAGSLPLNEQPYWQGPALAARLAGLRELAAAAPLPEPVRAELDSRLRYATSLVKANHHQLTGTQYVPTSRPPIKVIEEQLRGPQD